VPEAAAVAGIDRVDLLLRAAEAANQSGEFRRAMALAREAVAAIDPSADPLRAALAHERLGHYMLDAELELGQVDELVVQVCRRAVELVPAQPPTPLRARVAVGLAQALIETRDYQAVRRWAEEALATAKAADSTSDEAKALMILALLELRFGVIETARLLLRDAAARAATAGNRPLELQAWRDLGILEFDLGNLTAACAALDRAAKLAERSGLAWSSDGIDSRVQLCMAHYHAGHWDQAERMAAAADDRRPAAGSLSTAALYVEVGRGLAGATERLARLGPYRQGVPVAVLAGGCESDLAHWQGDLDKASAIASATLANREQAGPTWALSAIWPAALGLGAEASLAERARAADDQARQARSLEVGRDLLKRARAALQQARRHGRQVGPEALAWLARCEAEWTRLEGHSDPEAWRAAVDAFSYGYVYEEARSRWRLAEALLGIGDRQQAAAEARAAYQTAVRLQAEPLREALETLARRGRLEVGAHGEPGNAAGLTPRELEVLRLLVVGRSNRQIAEDLFISGKTAGVHVTRILAKLGVHSRLQAAARARELGLDRPVGIGRR
jgi:DNA-binding NarL/FixJ family response regulator/tetratricopeptide (TPR) repeat protein